MEYYRRDYSQPDKKEFWDFCTPSRLYLYTFQNNNKVKVYAKHWKKAYQVILDNDLDSKLFILRPMTRVIIVAELLKIKKMSEI